MFDIAWSELIIIGLVALVVIGPKDLPRVLRVGGQWLARARAMAREFQSGVDEMIRESELDEVKRKLNEAGSILDPLRDPLNLPPPPPLPPPPVTVVEPAPPADPVPAELTPPEPPPAPVAAPDPAPDAVPDPARQKTS